MIVSRLIGAVLLAGVLLTAPAAMAQIPLGYSLTGQPDGFDINGKTYVVDGYRSAKWGMTEAQVRAIVAKDFTNAKIGTPVEDPITRTTVLVVEMPQLDPGPVPAAVSYIFGATTKRLIHVNIDWQYADPTPEQRASLTVAGSRVVRDFISYYWKLLGQARGIPVGPTSLVLFAGQAEAGGNVEVRLQGVGYTVKTAKGEVVMPPPSGPNVQVLLHVGFAQTEGQADVYAIKPGEF